MLPVHMTTQTITSDDYATGLAEVKAISTTPIISPVIALLKSRKFITWVVAMIVSVMVHFIPELAPIQNELFLVIVVLATANILGISYEDAKSKGKAFIETNPIQGPEAELKQMILDLLLSDTTDQGAIAEQIAMMRAAKKEYRL